MKRNLYPTKKCSPFHQYSSRQKIYTTFLMLFFTAPLIAWSVPLKNSPTFKKSADIIIKGTVSEQDTKGDNNAVPGIIVREKGTNNATTTDANGNYTLKVKTGATLVFSALGYKSQEVLVKNQTTIDITMESDSKDLDEVVVTGYQKIDRSMFTGAAVKLKTEDVKLAGTLDVSRMLEGRAAGVSVQNVSGTFGTAPKLRIRGATSITGENKPLWVIDGVVLEDVINISNDDLASGNANTLLGSAVAGLNSDDIESFQILKDASATALYGARAMNGVVVITTKKGRVQKPVVSYSNNFSVTLKPTYSNFNIMNSNEQMNVYGEMERKGWLTYADVSDNDNAGVYGKMYDLISTYDPTTQKFGLANTPEAKAAFLQRYAKVNTDWFDILFKNSLAQEHSLSVNAGTESSQFYFSGSIYNDAGWTIADKVRRYTTTMRANFKLNNKVTLGITTVGSIREQQAPGSVDRISDPVSGKYDRDFDINPFSYAINTSRTLSAYDENGNLEYFRRNFAPFNIIHESANNFLKVNQLDFKIQPELQYKINKNITYTVIGAIRYVKSSRENNTYENSNQANAYRANQNSTIRDNNKFLYQDPDNLDADPIVVLPQGGIYKSTDDKLVSYYLRNQLNWAKTYDQTHILNVLLGQELRYADRQQSYFNGYGYQFDKGGVPYVDYHLIKQRQESNFNYYGLENFKDRFVAFFANASYSYKGKYTVNSTVRLDGSNQLGKSSNARWLPTWNVSGSWNLKDEAFLKDNNTISRFALRATYGLTASLGQATNSTAVFKGAITNRSYLSETESIINIENLENSELTWEKQYETNVGFDLGLLNNRINIDFDVYQRKGFDLIGKIKTGGVGGELYKYANYADMKSQGLDLMISASVLRLTDFEWKTGLTLGYNKNKITTLKSLPQIYDLTKPEGGAQQGYAVRGLFSLDYQGLDAKGIPTFINETGETTNGVYAQSIETKYLKYEGSVDPITFGGFTNTFSYKNLSLNIFISYQGGNKIRLNSLFNEVDSRSLGVRFTDIAATQREFANRWVLSGDEKITTIPAMIDPRTAADLGSTSLYPYTNYNISSDRVAKGDFVRLKNVSLNYGLPAKWAKAIGTNNLSVRVSATNLLLLYSDKKLLGQDPEFFGSGGVALPIPKQISLSLKTSF